MVSQTSAILLAAVFVSAYGLPADSTLVSAPAVMGGAYPQANTPVAVPVAVNQTTGVAPQADNATMPIKAGNDYGQSVDPDSRRRRRRHRRHGRESSQDRRGRSRTRRDSDNSDCSDPDSAVSERSQSRYSSASDRRSDSCDSVDSYRSGGGRSDSCDSRCDRSASRGSRSDSCDSRSGRSMSRGSRSQSCDSECDRDDRRRRRGHRRHRGFWMPIPFGPAPWGPRPGYPRPWGVDPYAMGPVPFGPSYGNGDDSECASPVQGRFFGDRTGVDRLNGYANNDDQGYLGQQGRRGGPDSHYSGVDAYEQGRPSGGYGQGDVYGGRNDSRGNYQNNGEQDYNGYGGRPIPRPQGGYPTQGRATLNVDHKFSQNDYDANMRQRSVNVNDRRNGRFSMDERHADEQSFDRSGRDRVMVDQFGQRATSRQEEIDAAKREADSRNVHISGPNGSLDSRQQSGSEDLFSSDRHERTFNGPNRSASERSFSTSTSSRDFSSESTRSIGRPSFRP